MPQKSVIIQRNNWIKYDFIIFKIPSCTSQGLDLIKNWIYRNTINLNNKNAIQNITNQGLNLMSKMIPKVDKYFTVSKFQNGGGGGSGGELSELIGNE